MLLRKFTHYRTSRGEVEGEMINARMEGEQKKGETKKTHGKKSYNGWVILLLSLKDDLI